MATHDDTAATVRYYPEEEIAALVRSLDRPVDQQLFSVDVLITYPSLADQYVRVCPQRCDLTTATQKALDGEYSHDQKLESLKTDVQLMVNNCVRFNGDAHPLSEAAADFERFAMQKIDQYLTSKMGGRRVSSLRLQQQLSQVPPPPPATAHTGSAKHAQKGAVAVNTRGAAAASSSSPQTHARHKELTKADLLTVIKGLVRREDAGAFEVDVAEAYPELKENYEKVCPVKMNLAMMREKAEKGAYNTTLSAIGVSVAESLPDVRTDIETIVNNCIRFNSQLPDWVRLAETFRMFAHRKFDDLVLRVAPSLRGTKTGAQSFRPTATSSPSSTQEVIQISSDSTTATASTAPTPGTKRPRASDEATPSPAKKTVQWENTDYVGPAVATVVSVAPSVCPTPLQPALAIPDRLHRRVVSDHLCRDTLHARFTGRTAPFMEVFPPIPAPVVDAVAGVPTTAEAASPAEPATEQDTATTDHATTETETEVAKPEVEKKAAKAGPSSTAAKVLQPPSASWPVVLTVEQSAQTVLESFRTSIHSFYEEKRHTSDFRDPFQYSLQDEALYMKILDTVEQQFENVFLGVLLYAQEAADVHEWIALQALKPSADGTVTASSANGEDTKSGEAMDAATRRDGEGSRHVHWAAAVHYTYLVRLLVQLPQIASLCSATLSTASGSQAPVVKVSREALDVLKRVTQFTEEFLAFIANYEETLLGSADMAKQLTE